MKQPQDVLIKQDRYGHLIVTLLEWGKLIGRGHFMVFDLYSDSRYQMFHCEDYTHFVMITISCGCSL